jgi:hypothetical protein
MATVQATDTWLYDGGYGGIAILIAVVLAAAAQSGANPVSRVLQWRPLVGLGLISYGVYLWHWPITVWLTAERTHLSGVALFAVRAVATLAASVASYVVVETPIRRGRLPRLKGLPPAFVPIAVVVALIALLAAPVLAYPTVNPVPKILPSRASASVSRAYAKVPRCDNSQGIRPSQDARGLKVQLFGNSVAVEAKSCLAAIVKAHGATFESVVHSGRAPCHILPRLRKQVENPATRPDVAIFSAAIINVEDSCQPELADWLVQVHAALDIWAAAGVHVYLVPLVPNVPGTGDPLPTEGAPFVPTQAPEFQAISEQDPAHITMVDAGLFIRDSKDTYQWRMPCVAGKEKGCDTDHSVGVRWVDGFHFCSDPNWDGHSCAPVDSGGERRVAAAIALQITELSGVRAPKAPPP